MNISNNTIISDIINLFFNILFFNATIRISLYLFNKNSSRIKYYVNNMVDFCVFIHNNNPLLIDYYDIDDISVNDIKIKKTKEKYEEKYIKKYKAFPNDFAFTEEEINLENEKYIYLKTELEKNNHTKTVECQNKIKIITSILSYGIDTETGLNGLLNYYDIDEEYNDDHKTVDLNEYTYELTKELTIHQNILDTLETDIELKSQSREYIINLKLDKFINNYITECTPIGIVHMRYNNLKKTFEYFSDNTIPYRYLETIGRKYVITFWCKPIFIDIEDELKQSETKRDEDLKQEKKNEDLRKNTPKNNVPKKSVMAQFKNYNTSSGNKNANMNKINAHTLQQKLTSKIKHMKNSEKQLLKMNANRYTREGRLHDLQILTKIIDKNNNMSFADFKRLQCNK